VQQRDARGYATAFARLARLHQVRGQVRERDAVGHRLSAAAPQLAEAVLSNPDDPTWSTRLAEFEQAWSWARVRSWVDTAEQIDVDRLQHEIIATEDRIRTRVQELAATRAWSHAVARLSRGARADLEQYVQLSNRFGKGTGQYRDQRRADLREAMVRCRPSVPVWIMPIYRIADQLRIEPDMFDVIVVDESSQAGLEATFLQYLAPRIVVIGDDKQVSPSAVGTDQQQLRDLARQHLFDDRYIASWQDPQRSLFDEAKMRFGGMLTLTEHRRCVPEIINFSNRIAYEPDGVRLIPVRQFGPDRLDPIRPVFVEGGYEKGGTTTRTNPAEIDAIVEQIDKCLTDPRYDGLTFGVISLLGPTQAKAIEKKLLDRVSPDEWIARDLRCGDAADFQGSERNVMFLSMVAAPGPDRRLTALTATLYLQRYNVAASRAKDQMWVFHSVGLNQLGNPEDMRFQLLDYCYGVRRRAVADDDRGIAQPVPEHELISPFGSLFEQRVCNRVTDRGYSVVPQYPVPGTRLQHRPRRRGSGGPTRHRVRRRLLARTRRLPARHGTPTRARAGRLELRPGARIRLRPRPDRRPRPTLGSAYRPGHTPVGLDPSRGATDPGILTRHR
jgi:AAA domain